MDFMALALSMNTIRTSFRRLRCSAPVHLLLLGLIAAAQAGSATPDDSRMHSLGVEVPEARSSRTFHLKLAAADPVAECEMHADCSDGNTCNGLELCRDGVCLLGTPPDCSPRDVCLSRSCDPRIGCVEQPLSGVGCDDGNVCTSGDVCLEGRCIAGQAVLCSDAGPCVVAACEPETGCSARPLADGSGCSDGDARTVNDRCRAGACVGDTVRDPVLEQEEDDALFNRDYDARISSENNKSGVA